VRKRQLSFSILLAGLLTAGMSLSPREPSSQDFRSGKDFLPVSAYSAGEDQELLQLFAGLRVADVSDGMDKAGRRELYKQLRLPPDSSIKK